MGQHQSPSAANTRRYVVVHKSDRVGAYDFNEVVTLSVRVDGLRFRYYRRGFAWVENEGGIHESERYLTPAEAWDVWTDFADQHKESFEEAVAAALAR